jgi:gliding motility-associated lipoprotein GldH
MKIRINKVLFYALLPWFVMFYSCNGDRIFEEYQGMENLHWKISDTVNFELPPIATENAVSTIGIKYNDTFEFHNLYVKVLLEDSLGRVLQDSLINIELFDSKTGKPLGDGFGNIFTKYDTLPFVEFQNQPLKAQFIQYMRKDQLEGIEAVGLKIVQE